VKAHGRFISACASSSDDLADQLVIFGRRGVHHRRLSCAEKAELENTNVYAPPGMPGSARHAENGRE
jgi:hypothetical protein